MRMSVAVRIVAALSLVSAGASLAAPPIEAFARLPQIRGVSISPDGARIVYIANYAGADDREVAVTMELAGGSPKIVTVGVLLRADGAFLLTSRPPGKVYEGYWEFPGGKVEAGETVEAALAARTAGRDRHHDRRRCSPGASSASTIRMRWCG